MKAREWQRTLTALRDQTGKEFYRSTELANISGANYRFIATSLARLVNDAVLVRYATGIYGLPDCHDVAQLVRALDPNAYVTGAAALYHHGLITQHITGITCFTNRRHNRSRTRQTPLGTLTFVCVSPPVYHPPEHEDYPSAAQALLDFVLITRRSGAEPQSVVTFTQLDRIAPDDLQTLEMRYPVTVRRVVREMGGEG